MNEELLDSLAEFSMDPLGFVLWAFPWGQPGTELEEFNGPDEWQIEVLLALGAGLINVTQAIQIARASGHGIGKSALVAWIILWAFSTFEDTKGVVTANTENQLKTKTWAELAKWFNLFIAKELFEFSATKITIRSTDTEKQAKWKIDMVPWSERNTEAFAGLHNSRKRILLVFDEASAIPDLIWETAEGALTDKNTEIIWCAFGNPTRNKGRFRECFPGGKFAHRWNAKAIDSRTVAITDKDLFARWVQDYGEDSDFVRIRVRGVFPRQDAEGFISRSAIEQAILRPLPTWNGWDVVLGVDVGRFGNDPSVIYPRQGPDARSRPVEILPGLSVVEVAKRVVAAYHRWSASVAFIDEGGVGGGVVDLCRVMGINVIAVDFGSGPDYILLDGAKYANKRSEIWGGLRSDIDDDLCLPEGLSFGDVTLQDELAAPSYQLNVREEIQLESKKDMRRRGIPSPNIADALACTYALPTSVPIGTPDTFHLLPKPGPTIMADYDPYSPASMKS